MISEAISIDLKNWMIVRDINCFRTRGFRFPTSNYSFPYSVHKKRGRDEKRFFNRTRLEEFHWLVLSNKMRGLFCKYCVLFNVRGVGGSNQLQKLVKKPLVTFAKLTGKDGDLVSHENNQYHRDSVDAGKHFLLKYDNPETNILSLVNEQRSQQVQENRARLKPIVESIVFLGRQNIALRGHRDDGELLAEKDPLTNEGNFRELLRYRVNSGDITLKQHLESSGANATYISKTTQNELIECCAKEILKEILARVHSAKFYSVVVDETTDVSHKSQLSIALCYNYNCTRREDFVGFLDLHETCYSDSIGNFEPTIKGETLGNVVLDFLRSLGLDLENCVGIGTDGCAMMVSEHCGAVKEVQKVAKNALRCPCFNHALNLSMSKTSSIQSVRNSIGVIKEIVAFFGASAKRNYVLTRVMKAQLTGMCETRWIERHDSLMQFVVELPKIVEALEIISGWAECTTGAKAKSLLTAVTSSDLIVTIYSLSNISGLILPLSRLFQKKSLDLASAASHVKDLLTQLQVKRRESESEFKNTFDEVTKVATELGLEITVPRIAKKQTNRINVPFSSHEKYYYYYLFKTCLITKRK